MNKTCALCGCLDENDSATCRFCGEATWIRSRQPVELAPEPALELVPVEAEPKKRGRK